MAKQTATHKKTAKERTGKTHAAEQKPTVPSEWPGAFGLYRYSQQAVLVNLSTLLLLFLVTLIISLPVDYDNNEFLVQIVFFIIGSLISTAFTISYLASIRRKAISIGDSLSESFPYLLKMVGLTIVSILILAGSVLLLIVPFFFVLPRIILANYFLVDKNMGVIEAIQASWNATKGHVIEVWSIIGVNILMLSLCLTIVGIPVALFLLFMYGAAFATFYKYLKTQPKIPAIVK